MAPASGIANLWFESPAIGAVIDKFRRIVLARRRNQFDTDPDNGLLPPDRKSTRLNSSHLGISYAAFCLKKKNQNEPHLRGENARNDKAVHGVLNFFF